MSFGVRGVVGEIANVALVAEENPTTVMMPMAEFMGQRTAGAARGCGY